MNRIMIILGFIGLGGCLILIALSLCSCQNMMHKAVGVDNSVTAFKITLGDATTYFIPQVIVGNGQSVLLDLPLQEGGEACYYREEYGIFSPTTVSRKTFIYMKAGKGAIKGSIKIETETGKIIDLPIFKMYNPFPIIPTTNIDGVPAK